MLTLHTDGISAFIDDEELATLRPRVLDAHQAIVERTGPGSDMLGWQDLASSAQAPDMSGLLEVAAEIRSNADVLLCIGIGGSYLGAKAVIDALSPYFGGGEGVEVLFAGHHISGAYLKDLLAHLEGRSVYVNVISKSGTTLEPALAFRLVRDWMADRFSDLERRIIVTTDPERGALNALRAKYQYRRFTIPPSVGGRFSVLTPVGLLPIAAAGIDVGALLRGAQRAHKDVRSDRSHPALHYAAARYALHRQGYATELLATFEPKLGGIGAWWQQLFGESEGKDRKGLYPSFVQYSTDLHSVGQYVQDGVRNLIETFLIVEEDDAVLKVPTSADPEDGLDYLVGRTMHYINGRALLGTQKAHQDGGVPVMTLSMPTLDAAHLGYLLYSFEHAVAVGGTLLGVNPFDQPGVEAYKKEMFSRLGRP